MSSIKRSASQRSFATSTSSETSRVRRRAASTMKSDHTPIEHSNFDVDPSQGNSAQPTNKQINPNDDEDACAEAIMEAANRCGNTNAMLAHVGFVFRALADGPLDLTLRLTIQSFTEHLTKVVKKMEGEAANLAWIVRYSVTKEETLHNDRWVHNMDPWQHQVSEMSSIERRAFSGMRFKDLKDESDCSKAFIRYLKHFYHSQEADYEKSLDGASEFSKTRVIAFNKELSYYPAKISEKQVTYAAQNVIDALSSDLADCDPSLVEDLGWILFYRELPDGSNSSQFKPLLPLQDAIKDAKEVLSLEDEGSAAPFVRFLKVGYCE